MWTMIIWLYAIDRDAYHLFTNGGRQEDSAGSHFNVVILCLEE